MSIGEIIGSYQLTAPADGNPFGPYWLATHLVTGEAFRLQRWGYECTQAEYLESMERISRLRHPHLLPVVEFGFVRSGMAWTVTRPQMGKSLDVILSQHDGPASHEVAELARGILAALELAHEQGVAHGSLELSSCIFGDDGIVVDGWGAVYASDHAMMDAQRRDRVAVTDILSALFPSPSPSLAAILASPPISMSALRADFEAAMTSNQASPSSLLPSPNTHADFQDDTLLGPFQTDTMRAEIDEHTVEMGAPMSTLSVHDTVHEASDGSRPPSMPSSGNDGDISRTQEQMNPITHGRSGGEVDSVSALRNTPAINATSIRPAEMLDGRADWLDDQREDIRASNRYRPLNPAEDDSWGVIDGDGDSRRPLAAPQTAPLGMRVHTVRDSGTDEFDEGRHDADGATWVKWVVAVGVILGLAIIVSTYTSTSTADQTVEQQIAPTEEDELLALIDTQAQSERGEQVADASTVPNQPSVLVTFAPVEVTVSRADNGEVICENARECELPINVNYRATHPKYDVLLISGDDLYDRRVGGRWRRVMKPKTAGANSGR